MTRDDNHEHSEHNEDNTHHEHPHDPPNGKHSRPAGDVFTNPWMPGLVQVEFKNPADSGVVIEILEDAREQHKPSDQWCSELLQVLRDNRMSAWKPSFPLRPPGSKQSRDDAEDFYKRSGRQKFVTFRFADEANVAQIAAELKQVPEIERAKPVAKVVPAQINDPYFGESDQVQPFASGLDNQWYAFRCNLPEALEQVNGKGVVIAAIDWGFDVSHPDYCDAIKLRKNVKYDSEAVGNGNLIHHGTGTLGLAGARRNSEGMVGFAPDSDLWAIQAGEDEEYNPDHWVNAIDFVRQEPSPQRKVIILEVQSALRGNIEGDLVINQAIHDAVAANIVVCVPAGNGSGDAGKDDLGNDIPETGSVLVGATSAEDLAIGKTGDRITVYAPGDPEHDLTCSSLPDRYTNYFGGTSGAVAKVGGAVALLLEAHASLTPPDVKEILRTLRTKAVYTTETGEKVEAGYLLDCSYAVSECKARRGQVPVLTNYSAMV